MKAFLTGSRAYGLPNSESDVDIVLIIEDDAVDILLDLCDECTGSAENESVSLKFGKLNLICVSKEKAKLWKKGTKKLIKQKPVSREEAIKVFKTLFGTL